MSWFSIFSLVVAIAVSSAVGANIEVTVGKDAKLTYVPETIVAQIGDTVTYHFFPKNHSVTQSSFSAPCKPLAGGFFSGFVPTKDLAITSATTFTIEVKDTKPIWVYCGQTVGDHCQSGMVHAINAPTSGANTIDRFKTLAKAAPTSQSPPDGLPVGGLRKTTIDVGPAGTLKFSPQNVTSLVGEVLEFTFNPKNHSVVQSNFANPCQPLSGGGFSSGFVPTKVSPSGSNFQITVRDTKPIWFYCAQTVATHCQAGMVGSVNAPAVGNTIDAFIALAAKAPTSTIPDKAPLGGTLTIDGKAVTADGEKPPTDAGGDKGGGKGGDSAPPSNYSMPNVPEPGAAIPTEVASMAGGYQPSSYNWAPSISDEAAKLLQLINWVDNILLEVLVSGHNNLTTGGWKNLYPQTITNTLGSMSAQALVHRSTSTDSLAHYSKQVIGMCKYSFPINAVEDFVKVALILILLEIALLLDVIGVAVKSDTWMVAPLASTLGSKARMAGMVNMMQNHIPAAAPREVMLPAEYVHSYISNNYIVPGSCPHDVGYPVYPPLKVVRNPADGAQRATDITVTFEAGKKDLSMAWIGPWGKVWYTPVVSKSDTEGTASVPNDLSGHVWGVLTNKTGSSLGGLPDWTVAGPALVWVTQPS